MAPAPPPEPADPVERLYRELEAKIREYRPKDDLAPLRKAFRFASQYHEGQTRDSGEPYMVHPVMVAHILADMRMDVVAMETGLLHDVVEDTSVTVEQVRKEFGEEVARCVDGVTKLTKLDFFSAEDRQAESFRKMLLAMVEDIRVIMVKLADRMHNMRTLGYLEPGAARAHRARDHRNLRAHRAPPRHGQGPRRTGRPGLPAPRARRLPGNHRAPSNRAAIPTKNFSNEIRQTVEAELRREGIPARIDGRVKRPYSVFQKLRRQKITVDQVYDLMALRIITDSVKNCYARARRDPQQVAAHSGPHQGFHRHPAAQSVPVAAHLGGRAARADIRSADPHRRDAPHRRRRHRGALEI